MHELALCQAIVETVRERAPDRAVPRVHVRIGHLRQVVPDSLQMAWEVLTRDSALTGAELVIDHVAAVVRCRACGTETTLEMPVLACERCQSHDVELLRGDELLIASFDVAAEVG